LSKILIVDDDLHIRDLVSLTLREEHFDVYEACDGAEALSKLEAIKVDMVILDVMMPTMNGWELCAELRKQYVIPLLMLTVHGETSQKVKGFRLGADDYLVKPFDQQELIVRV
jgi:DNA-binding response OmpR family regulator